MHRITFTAAVFSSVLIIVVASFGFAVAMADHAAVQAAPLAADPVPPLDADRLSVAEIIELPLLAGPGRTSAHLAPDGNRLAYLNGEALCILEIASVAEHIQRALLEGVEFEETLYDLTEQPDDFAGVACILSEIQATAHETVQWSPDGRYLVMAELFFQTLTDSDIWVLDTNTMLLTDITDDGEAKFSFAESASQGPLIDVAPRWLPDGRLVFLRYTGQGEKYDPPYVYTVQPDGSDLQQAGQLETPQNFAVSALAVSVEGKLAYNLQASSDELELLNGLWISDLDGGNAQHIWHSPENPVDIPVALDWSPDGQYVAVSLASAGAYSVTYEPGNSRWRAVRVSDGQEVLFSTEHFVHNVGWAPDGSAIVYTTGSIMDKESEGLYVAAEPGATGRLLVPAHPDMSQYPTPLVGTTPLLGQLLPWTADNNTVMVGRGPKRGLLIIRLAHP